MRDAVMVPKLSICVPSRNRQLYFLETIRALTSSRRNDIEFVFADNSDDPSIMNDFIGELSDHRVVYLPSASKTYSMIDNWERTVAASTGEWITVIGDDDYLDPELADVLTRVAAVKPDLEAFEWTRLSYAWPNPETDRPTNADVTFGNGVSEIPKKVVQLRAFQWEDALVSPIGGFSIYHAAISRKLLERIRACCDGHYFEHPVVDFDFAFKAAMLGESFAFSQRPFSVLGACPKSNSASLHDLAMVRQRNAEFMEELGRNMDADDTAKDFPFPSWLGVTITVMHVHLALKAKHRLAFSGWEANFVKACVRNCEEHRDKEMFDAVADGYRTGFRLWRHGRYLKDFNPVFNQLAADAKEVFSGFHNGKLHISMPLLNAQTPVEFFEIVAAMVPAAADIDPVLQYPKIHYR